MQKFRMVLTRRQLMIVGAGAVLVLLGIWLGWASANSAGQQYQAKYRANISKLQTLANQTNGMKLSDLTSVDDDRVTAQTTQQYAVRCSQLDTITRDIRIADTVAKLPVRPLGLLSSSYRHAQKQSAQLQDNLAAFKAATDKPLQYLKQYCVVSQGDLPVKLQELQASKEYQKTLFHGSALIKLSLTSYREYTCNTSAGCRPDRFQKSQFAAYARAYKHRWVDTTNARIKADSSYPAAYRYCSLAEAAPLCVLNYGRAKGALKLYQNYYNALVGGKSDAEIEKAGNAVRDFTKQWNTDYYTVLKKTFPKDDTTKPDYIQRKNTKLLQAQEAKTHMAAAKLLRQLAMH